MKHKFLLLAAMSSYFCSYAEIAPAIEDDDVLSSAIGQAVRYTEAEASACSEGCTSQYTDNVKYVEGALLLSGWGDNWFVGAQGGGSTFVGNPLGCDDLFGRTRPLLRGYVGKWIAPEFGIRAVFEGLKLQDYAGVSRNYQSYHADLMWNVLGRPYRGLENRKWILAPYVGCGFIHTDIHYHSPFAVNYGVFSSYKLSNRLSLNLEIGGTTSTSSLDNYPGSHRWADNLFGVSAGFSYTIGKCGWKRVVDPKPYMDRNLCLESENARLYRLVMDPEARSKRIPNNNYSGLNSLRARIQGGEYGLRKGVRDGYRDDSGNGPGSIDESELLFGDVIESADQLERFFNEGGFIAVDSIKGNSSNWEDGGSLEGKGSAKKRYLSDMASNKAYIGTPVFFFFKLGTDVLVDNAQLVNLDEVADLARNYGLKIRIVGSADSSTGSEEINSTLSEKRAEYIKNQLVLRGVPSENIRSAFVGGMDKYSPAEANRLTSLEMYF